MKRFALASLTTVILTALAQQFFPWWSIVPAAGLAGYFFKFKNSWISFFAGFVAVTLLWGGYAEVLNYSNDGILAAKMGDLFGGLNGIGMLVITAFVGGIFGGLGAMCGNLGRKITEKKELAMEA